MKLEDGSLFDFERLPSKASQLLHNDVIMKCPMKNDKLQDRPDAN